MLSNTIQAAVARILKPLVRVLIRQGVSWGEFSEVARRVFVETAASDFPLEGRKQTNARIAMLTGIQRKEVGRLVSLPPIETAELDLQYNRGVRVTSGWRRDPDFLDNGRPRPLPMDGPNGFAELVRRYSGDLTARAVLDELVRLGVVEVDDEDQVILPDEAVHVPGGDLDSQINILGYAGRDLFATIDHNLTADKDDKRLQLTVAYNNLPANAATRFRHISHEESLQLLKRFDSWLAEHDRDANADVPEGDDRVRAGIGIYYFEEDIE